MPTRPPATIHEELLKIRWPREFVVEYTDGSRERLLRGDGVAIIPPADDLEGHGALCAEIPRKHPRNQKRCGRYIRFTELQAIHSPDGQQLWPRG